MRNTPPSTETALIQRAQQLAGKTLGELANEWQEPIPLTLHRAKGWAGQFIEKVLGANAFNLDQPDFVDLGIELKTLPIHSSGQPYGSTYICALSLPNTEFEWEQSRVWRKMKKILWIPLETAQDKTLSALRIGTPLLWSPEPEIAQQLKQDWEELMEEVALGHFNQLSAHKGHYLQIRPKAANAKTFVQVINHEGQTISTVPKGFYLRSKLTQEILNNYYVL